MTWSYGDHRAHQAVGISVPLFIERDFFVDLAQFGQFIQNYENILPISPHPYSRMTKEA
ncbi:hypothetical protein [Paenibacillus sp. Y412MC10]|uniref:hypothetical protein n=1 Tax=Geobacillus sp. (strain Y412MC10) TaxID=481743 RepID=UPI001C930A91|nr:hypothetical protein [Paenibacillus sp. Y412MC10]